MWLLIVLVGGLIVVIVLGVDLLWEFLLLCLVGLLVICGVWFVLVFFWLIC